MKLEGGKISNSHLIFLIIGFTVGTSVLIPPGIAAKHDGWLAILAGLCIGLIFNIIYATLAISFPGKTLIQFNDIIYGPFLGKFISIGYLWFFLHTDSLIIRTLGDFSTTNLPQTPMEVFVICFMLISASAVRNGIEVITRCSLVLVSFMVFFIFGTTILLLKDINITNLLPILDLPLIEFIKGSHSAAIYPFSQQVIFLMVIPFLNNPNQVKKPMIIALIIAGIILLINTIINISVLGDIATISSYPSFQSIRMINILNGLTRLEIVVAINFSTMIFLKISVFYYCTVLGIAQLLKLRSYQPLVFPVGILITIISISQFDSAVEQFTFLANIFPYYSSIFQFVIPLLSLIIILIRGLQKNERSHHKEFHLHRHR